ncbi:hypothetical protein K1719_041301 [Acacia pycnantha]|nr:hypothetical protein K1719_041301 [Acacia pycnantha]
MAHGASSSSITDKWSYDVFLSFRGEDTRSSFASLLYSSLIERGIRVFRDDDKLRKGENITSTVLNVIHESRIAIIIFSENYANSVYCLQELIQILECSKEEGRLIYPVYCIVDPSEVWARLKEKWRPALSQEYHSLTTTTDIREVVRTICERVTTSINEKRRRKNSAFRLKELIQILESGEGRLIYPVFYDVDPVEVQNQIGRYAEERRLPLHRLSDYDHFLPKTINVDECIGVIVERVTAWMNEKEKYWVWDKGEEIGSGAHGNVYVAHHWKTRAICGVVKELKRVGAYEYMQKEINFLRQLEEHPNIVKYYDLKEVHILLI